MKQLQKKAFANQALYALSLAFAGLIISQENAQAASSTWLDTGSSQNWSSTANWQGGFAPGGTSANTDTATFNSAVGTVGTSTTPIVIDTTGYPSGLFLGNITFDTAAGSYFLGAVASTNPIDLNAGGTIQIANTLTATNSIETLNAPLTLGGAATFSNNSANGTGAGAGTLDFTGAVTGSGTNTLTLSGSNTNLNTLTGAVSGANLLVDKEGTGTWVLNSNSSSFGSTSGGVTIGGGTLVAQGTNGLGYGPAGSATSGSVLTVNSGGTLDLQGTLTFGGTLSGSGTITNSSNVTTDNITIKGIGSSSFTGVIEDSLGLGTGTGKLAIIYGNGGATAQTLTLSGNNLFTGGISTTPNSGHQGATTVIFTQLSDTGNSALGHSGTMTVSAGTVFEFLTSGTNAASTGRAIALGNSVGGIATLDSSSASPLATFTSTVANVFIGGSSGTTTLNLQGTNTGANTIQGTLKSGTGTNVAALTKNGTGTWILTTTGNTYSAGTTINAGTLQFAKTGGMPASGAITVNSTGTLAVNAGGTGEFTSATSGNGTIGGLFSGLGGQTGSTVVLNSGSAVGIDTTNAGGSLTYAGNITNSGVGLTKRGTGSLVLTGTDTYSGATTVTSGSLLFGTGGSSNSTSAVAVAAGATLGTVTGNVSSTTLFSSAAGLTLNLGASTATQSNLQLNLYTLGVSDALNVGTLTLNGSGNLLVTANDTTSNHLSGTYTLLTWTGGTSLTNGELSLAGTAASEGSLSISGNSLIYTVAVPEPSTWCLLLCGSAVLFVSGLKRRNKLS